MLDRALAATTSADRVFVSPNLVQKTHNERIGYIVHELSHAHLQQYVGTLALRLNLPNWFKEGLAVLVSHGGGAGMVSDTKAATFICSGRVFEPTENGLDVIQIQARQFNDLKPFPMPMHMLYRQNMMFVWYLKQLDTSKFKQLIESLENGGNFRNSFIAAYGQDVQSVFDQFVQNIRLTYAQKAN